MKHDLYIFGSAARGDVATDSDIDVLVVPTDGAVPDGYPPTWSVYSRETLASYFAQGRLFAWHLYLEARVIYSVSDQPWLKYLGPPAPYQTAASDIRGLRTLLGQSISEIRRGTPSLVYEMGLIYTALRDIAMSASWVLMDAPCFSRRSPYQLPLVLPLPENLYNLAMAARHASTRGAPLPKNIEAGATLLISCQLDEWAKSICEMI